MDAIKEANKIIDQYDYWQRADIKATVKLWFKNVLGYLFLEIFVTLVVLGAVTLIKM